jgi:hypothetical protein
MLFLRVTILGSRGPADAINIKQPSWGETLAVLLESHRQTQGPSR